MHQLERKEHVHGAFRRRNRVGRPSHHLVLKWDDEISLKRDCMRATLVVGGTVSVARPPRTPRTNGPGIN